jgi:hypothetical protein
MLRLFTRQAKSYYIAFFGATDALRSILDFVTREHGIPTIALPDTLRLVSLPRSFSSKSSVAAAADDSSLFFAFNYDSQPIDISHLIAPGARIALNGTRVAAAHSVIVFDLLAYQPGGGSGGDSAFFSRFDPQR